MSIHQSIVPTHDKQRCNKKDLSAYAESDGPDQNPRSPVRAFAVRLQNRPPSYFLNVPTEKDMLKEGKFTNV